jgi:glucose-6-phosphate 1-epimerase
MIDPDTEIRHLNDQFGIPDRLSFREGPGALPMAEVRNDFAVGGLFLHGAHVTAFQPHGHKPVIWLSKQSCYQSGKTIRGGIPVCWPWFADHPTDPTKPAHGFVRTAPWTVRETGENIEGGTFLRLGFRDDPRTRALWPFGFDLELSVTFGAQLIVSLSVKNNGTGLFTCGGALHSYFAVSDSSHIHIQGLDGLNFIDKVDGYRRKIQRGPVTIQGETDSIYLETERECYLEDPVWQRRIRIAKRGSRTTVVWNPWSEKAAAMKDFGDKKYREMVCVETTNAADDQVTVAPGGKHVLEAVIEVVRA